VPDLLPLAKQLPLDEIFREHAPYVWRALKRLGVHEPDTDDVCQEVFVVAFRKIETFDGSSSMRTWLYGISIRVAAKYRRTAHRRREQLTSEVPEGSAPALQEQVLERRRAMELLDRALDELDEDKRAVFVLYEIEEIPMIEVAKAMSCPLQTAYSRHRAARKIVEAVLFAAEKEATSP
jgi:RNA polymerase sigma-70 factor (ECF subfamily)